MFCIIQTQLRLSKLLPMFCVFSISFRHLQPQTVSQTHRQQHLPCTHDSIQQNTIFPTINPVVIVIVVAWAHLIHPLCESTRNPRHPSLSAAFIVSGVRQNGYSSRWRGDWSLESVSAGCMRRPTAATLTRTQPSRQQGHKVFSVLLVWLSSLTEQRMLLSVHL